MQTEELNVLRTEREFRQLVTSNSTKERKKLIVGIVNLRTRCRESEKVGITCHRRRTTRLSKRFLLLLLVRVCVGFLFLPYSVFGDE